MSKTIQLRFVYDDWGKFYDATANGPLYTVQGQKRYSRSHHLKSITLPLSTLLPLFPFPKLLGSRVTRRGNCPLGFALNHTLACRVRRPGLASIPDYIQRYLREHGRFPLSDTELAYPHPTCMYPALGEGESIM
jgi:hypothetical protein